MARLVQLCSRLEMRVKHAATSCFFSFRTCHGYRFVMTPWHTEGECSVLYLTPKAPVSLKPGKVSCSQYSSYLRGNDQWLLGNYYFLSSLLPGGIWGGFHNIIAGRMGLLVVRAWFTVIFLPLWPLLRRNWFCLAMDCHPLLFVFVNLHPRCPSLKFLPASWPFITSEGSGSLEAITTATVMGCEGL